MLVILVFFSSSWKSIFNRERKENLSVEFSHPDKTHFVAQALFCKAQKLLRSWWMTNWTHSFVFHSLPLLKWIPFAKNSEIVAALKNSWGMLLQLVMLWVSYVNGGCKNVLSPLCIINNDNIHSFTFDKWYLIDTTHLSLNIMWHILSTMG